MAKTPTQKPPAEAPVAEPAPAPRVYPGTGGSIVLDRDGKPVTTTEPKEG